MIAQSTLTEAKLPKDFHRLWGAFTVSQLGSSLSTGALPLIAIIVLRSSDFRVSLLAALSAVVSAAVAVPLSPFVEFRRKRPVMIGTNLLCFATLATVTSVRFAIGCAAVALLSSSLLLPWRTWPNRS
ncbi:hypothetical protein ABZ942_08315 [Nocardia sp. NPDC046473]|uniref:hypothetical protein n=1 Tax=Nocardia sp. NPDC046473 TaxID=3155733 RepID=UPI0033DCA618